MTGPLYICGGELASSIHMLEHALIQAEIRDDPVVATHGCTSLATLSYCNGRLRRSREISVLRATWEEQSGQPIAVEQIHLWLVLLCASRGEWADAERMLAHLRPALEQLASNQSDQTSAIFVHQVRGFLAYQRGDYDTAANECNTVASGPPNDLESLMISPGLYGLAHLAIGNHAAARASMAELERLLAKMPNDTLAAAPLMTALALIAIGLGERAKFSDLYDRLEPFQGQLYWFLVDRVRGMLATLLGNWAAASQHLEAAEATARREGLLPELARVLAAQADLELASDRQGNAGRAINLPSEAHAIMRRLQISVAGQHIPHHHLRALTRSAAGYSWPEYPAGLSPREVSVLRLVAATGPISSTFTMTLLAGG
jgi:tetratricopeptide (TPR) repeat protein